MFFAQKEYIQVVFEPTFGEHYRLFFAPIITLVWVRLLLGKNNFDTRRLVGLLLFWIAAITLWWYYQDTEQSLAFFDVHPIAVEYLDTIPTVILCIGLILLSLYLLFHISYTDIATRVGKNAKIAYQKQIDVLNSFWPDPVNQKRVTKLKSELKKDMEMYAFKRKQRELESKISRLKKEEQKEQISFSQPKKTSKKKIHVEDKDATHAKVEKKPVGSANLGSRNLKWDYPDAELLKFHKKGTKINPRQIELLSTVIQNTLLQFRIDVEMHWFEIGPTVIQFRLKPAEWTKLNKIENLKKDLALALKAKSVRIQAPIPGMGLVGIEVPNEKREMISLREVVEAPVFKKHPSNLAMCVGKDVSGNDIVCNLAEMPHLLIAGQTGAGKSVGMNGFLVSLLMKNSPSQLRMIMIDPKRVELGVYNGIPHLLVPVINHPDKALNALKWSVAEMVRRYDLLTEERCRNLAEFNQKVTKKNRLPNIAIVIDELADLMMSGNKKDVENAIARIAQMARAVGMHLIVATQRPSVDVITGLIKANIPSRIAFTVASQVDSRTILDRVGAEDLLGRWDMLYAPSGSMWAERIQWVFVDVHEVESIVNHIKRTIDPAMLEDLYDNTIVDGESTVQWADGQSVDLGDDEQLVQEAIEIVRGTGKASTSMLQRRLKLGYARAARVMDLLEELGVVGPAEGSKPRQVL